MLALAESERCDVVRFVAPAVTRAQPASALVGSLCVQRAASGTFRGGLLSYLILPCVMYVNVFIGGQVSTSAEVRDRPLHVITDRCIHPCTGRRSRIVLSVSPLPRHLIIIKTVYSHIPRCVPTLRCEGLLVSCLDGRYRLSAWRCLSGRSIRSDTLQHTIHSLQLPAALGPHMIYPRQVVEVCAVSLWCRAVRASIA